MMFAGYRQESQPTVQYEFPTVQPDSTTVPDEIADQIREGQVLILPKADQ